MKTIILIILFSAAILAQSPLLTLMDESGLSPYPKTDDLVASYDENEMTISSWVDQTGELDFEPAIGTPSIVTSALNGYPSLKFDGSSLATTTITVNQPLTIYFVIKINSWADGEVILSGNNLSVAEGGGANNVYMWAGSYEPIRSFGNGEFKIASCVYNGASSIFQVNDNIEAGNSGTGALGNINIGVTSDTEFICLYLHNTVHDLTARTEIINWLNAKYGIF